MEIGRLGRALFIYKKPNKNAAISFLYLSFLPNFANANILYNVHEFIPFSKELLPKINNEAVFDDVTLAVILSDEKFKEWFDCEMKSLWRGEEKCDHCGELIKDYSELAIWYGCYHRRCYADAIDKGWRSYRKYEIPHAEFLQKELNIINPESKSIESINVKANLVLIPGYIKGAYELFDMLIHKEYYVCTEFYEILKDEGIKRKINDIIRVVLKKFTSIKKSFDNRSIKLSLYPAKLEERIYDIFNEIKEQNSINIEEIKSYKAIARLCENYFNKWELLNLY